MKDLSLILPVYQEEKIIEKVFIKIHKILNDMKISFEIILVENGSRDNSLVEIKKITSRYPNVRVLVTKKGYGRAIKKGFEHSEGKYVAYMPSDGQVDFSIFPKLWSIAKTNKYEIVKTRRANRDNWQRKFISFCFSRIMHLLFKTPIIDINGNVKILLKEKLVPLKINSNDEFVDGEMLIKATKLGWKIKEVSMKNMERAGGKSTRKMSTYFDFLKNIYNYKVVKKY